MSRPQAAPRADIAAERWFQWTEPVDAVTERHAVPAPGAARHRAAAPATGRHRAAAPTTGSHRAPAPTTGSHRAPPPAPPTERRRRAQHFARRRRDLLVDVGLALVLAIILISVTAGLGILVLVVVPMAAGLIAHRIIVRRRARRRVAPVRAARRSPRPRARSSRG
ncbi:MAG TPA: hypothetical protein VFN87_14520 [Solirubrobacteraceae bacterium]|nr:hypothetical protein [Solirubrobacteraceae bacterium]